MLKLLLSSNPIIHDLINHCLRYNGSYSIDIASLNGIGKGIKGCKWHRHNHYTREDFRKFIDRLKADNIEFTINSTITTYGKSSSKVWTIEVPRI